MSLPVVSLRLRPPTSGVMCDRCGEPILPAQRHPVGAAGKVKHYHRGCCPICKSWKAER